MATTGVRGAALLGALLLGCAACTIPTDGGAAPSTTGSAALATPTGELRSVDPGPSGAVVPTSPAATSPGAVPPGPSAAGGRSLVGRTVFLDPGHNASSDPAYNGRQVPTGRGGTKDCQTSGTSTDDGYPEHTFTFDVAQRVAVALRARGAVVLLSRPDDAGEGPCVDERAAAENASGADVVVSIHGDGAASSGLGFHVAYSSPPLNPAQAGPSVQLAGVVRDAMVRAGYTPSTYVGTDGLDPRDDLAGLNLAERPSVLVECANMRNPAEAAVVSSPAGRQGYADALVAGITTFVGAR